MLKMSIAVSRVENGYLVEVDRFEPSECKYVASSAEQAIRIIRAVLSANEESNEVNVETTAG